MENCPICKELVKFDCSIEIQAGYIYIELICINCNSIFVSGIKLNEFELSE